MATKKLVTLLEIAKKLQINHRSVIECKNIFENHLAGLHDGRHFRYWSVFIQFFDKIFFLKSQGYSFLMLRDILEDAQSIPAENPELASFKEWFDENVARKFLITVDNSREQTTTDDNGRERTTTDENGRQQMRTDQEGRLPRIKEDEGREEMLKEETYKKIKASDIEEIKEELKQVDKRITAQKEWMEVLIREMVPQINAGLTRTFSHNMEQINLYNILKERLTELENDLGISREKIETCLKEYELVQIQIPEDIEIFAKDQKSKQDVTLEIYIQDIKDSIVHNIPDKELLIKWINQERSKEDIKSYAQLAELLDENNIPTLRGRSSWNRAVVRNLALLIK